MVRRWSTIARRCLTSPSSRRSPSSSCWAPRMCIWCAASILRRSTTWCRRAKFLRFRGGGAAFWMGLLRPEPTRRRDSRMEDGAAAGAQPSHRGTARESGTRQRSGVGLAGKRPSHFALHYQGSATPQLANDILRTLEDDDRSLQNDLHFAPPESIGVILIRSRVLETSHGRRVGRARSTTDGFACRCRGWIRSRMISRACSNTS